MQIKNKKGEVLSIVEAETLQGADLRYSNLYEAQLAQINLNEKLAFAQRIIVMQPNPAILYQDFLKYSLIL